MSGPQFFVNPFGLAKPLFPQHIAGIVPIINPTGPPDVIAIGHNGVIPFAHQLHPRHAMHVAHIAHHDYDYVGIIVVTRSPRSGMFEILMLSENGNIGFDIRQARACDNPDTLLNRLLTDYGIVHFGKHTQIRHVEHSDGSKYKFCIVFAPELSRTRINARRKVSAPHCLSLQRFFLPKHKIGSSIKDNYGSSHSVSPATSNIIYAISNMLATITY